MNLISRSVFRFGSPCTDAFFGHCVLRHDGVIYGYDHPNERFWRQDGKELTILNEANVETSRYASPDGGKSWFGHVANHKWPMCLIPILTNAVPANQASHLPPVLVNSIPKSGTYFAEDALKQLGWQPLRLHLLKNGVDDYRSMPDAEMHVEPERVRIVCPSHMTAAIMQPGQLAVGHIEDLNAIDQIRRLGVIVLSCVRNLRDILISLYRFKLDRVKPTGPEDSLWRRMKEPERVACFLSAIHARDIAHVTAIAKSFLDDAEALRIRYEDMAQGQVPDRIAERFESIQPGLGNDLAVAFKRRLNKANSTFSGKRSNWREYWSDSVEQYFSESGLLALNNALGYE